MKTLKEKKMGNHLIILITNIDFSFLISTAIFKLRFVLVLDLPQALV